MDAFLADIGRYDLASVAAVINFSGLHNHLASL